MDEHSGCMGGWMGWMTLALQEGNLCSVPVKSRPLLSFSLFLSGKKCTDHPEAQARPLIFHVDWASVLCVQFKSRSAGSGSLLQLPGETNVCSGQAPRVHADRNGRRKDRRPSAVVGQALTTGIQREEGHGGWGTQGRLQGDRARQAVGGGLGYPEL